jgi:hypothetical protein
MEPWRAGDTVEAWRLKVAPVCHWSQIRITLMRIKIQPDPDPLEKDKSDPDPHENEKSDPDRIKANRRFQIRISHKSDAYSQQCLHHFSVL